jgi:hypothetical protein
MSEVPFFDWNDCVSQLDETRIESLKAERGYSNEILSWAHKSGLLGWWQNGVAFAVHDESGSVVGCHYRLSDGSWRYTKGSHAVPWVIGDLPSAKEVHIFESPWDALEFCDKTKAHECDWVAIVVTRGAENGAAIRGMMPKGAEIYAWPQNDPESNRNATNGLTASERWQKAIRENAGSPVFMVVTPPQHKDLNDWGRADATADDYRRAMNEAMSSGIQIPREQNDEPAGLSESVILYTPDSGNGGNPTEAIPLAPFEAYYDSQKKEYLTPNSGGRWLSLAPGQFKLRLRAMGFSTKAPSSDRVSEADAFMLGLQDRRDVRYSGSLAGYNAGFYDKDGVRFLVTDSPRIIQPAPGDWSTIKRLLDNLIGSEPEHGAKQLETFMGWVQVAYRCLVEGKWQPGQALALAGPVQCGKSLLQSLVTEILGGRCAKPYRYLAGRTDFNSELFGAEHLAIEDDQSVTDMRSRIQFGASIKNITVNGLHSCHGKGRDAVNLRPHWRLTISVNDREEALLVLPPITDDIADKLILLRCSPPKEGFPTGTVKLREAYWKQLVSEIPAFLEYLSNWEIPADSRSDRFGIVHFHHPEILQALEALCGGAQLLELIDRRLWETIDDDCWEGTAMELEAILRHKDSEVSFEAGRLLSWPNACGTYLGQIEDKRPERVVRHRTASKRSWVIRKEFVKEEPVHEQGDLDLGKPGSRAA